jgi:hypothetical protein
VDILHTDIRNRLKLFVVAFAAAWRLPAAPDSVGAVAGWQARPRPSPPAAPAQAPAGPLAEAVPLVDKRLGNGLDVIVLEDHSIPLVTVEWRSGTGPLPSRPS